MHKIITVRVANVNDSADGSLVVFQSAPANLTSSVDLITAMPRT